jgi:acetyl esterase/lipase
MGCYAPWIMDYAITYEAIVVSPNHRLLPKSTGLEIMEDLSDFWKWTKGGLQPLVSSNTEGQAEVDLSKILVQGESPGKSLPHK